MGKMKHLNRVATGAVAVGAGLFCCLACKNTSADAAPATTVAPAASSASTPGPVASFAAAAPVTGSSAGAAVARKYDVFGVSAGDVLNVRAEPSASSKKVYSFAPEVHNIVATGKSVEKDKTPWMEVSFDGGSGWINRLFVTEHHAGNGCDDPALTALIRAFMRAVAASDATALQALVSPVRGLSLRESRWNPTVNVALADVPALFTSATPRAWGKADGRDESIVEPFKQHLLPNLRRAVAGKNAQEGCGKLLMGGSASSNDPPPEYAAMTYVSFHQPSSDTSNDWVTWLMGIEYVDGKPYVATLVQYQWEI